MNKGQAPTRIIGFLIGFFVGFFLSLMLLNITQMGGGSDGRILISLLAGVAIGVLGLVILGDVNRRQGFMQRAMLILPFFVLIAAFVFAWINYNDSVFAGINVSNWRTFAIPQPYSNILQILGVPADWLFAPAIVYLFVLPFLVILTINYGFLNKMEIFGPDANLIIAVAMSYMTIPFGIFVKFVAVTFSVLSAYSVISFAGLFIFGVIYVWFERMAGWGFIRGGGSYQGFRDEESYDDLRNWLMEYEDTNRTLVPTLAVRKRIINDLTSADALHSDPKKIRDANRKLRDTVRFVVRRGIGNLPARRPPL